MGAERERAAGGRDRLAGRSGGVAGARAQRLRTASALSCPGCARIHAHCSLLRRDVAHLLAALIPLHINHPRRSRARPLASLSPSFVCLALSSPPPYFPFPYPLFSSSGAPRVETIGLRSPTILLAPLSLGTSLLIQAPLLLSTSPIPYTCPKPCLR